MQQAHPQALFQLIELSAGHCGGQAQFTASLTDVVQGRDPDKELEVLDVHGVIINECMKMIGDVGPLSQKNHSAGWVVCLTLM